MNPTKKEQFSSLVKRDFKFSAQKIRGKLTDIFAKNLTPNETELDMFIVHVFDTN